MDVAAVRLKLLPLAGTTLSINAEQVRMLASQEAKWPAVARFKNTRRGTGEAGHIVLQKREQSKNNGAEVLVPLTIKASLTA